MKRGEMMRLRKQAQKKRLSDFKDMVVPRHGIEIDGRVYFTVRAD